MVFSSGCVVVTLIGLLLCALQLSSAAVQEKPAAMKIVPGTHTFTVTAGGIERSYLVRVPPAYDAGRKWPVVMMFHGGGGTAKGAVRDTGWADKADKEGFLAVFPEGTCADPTRPARFRDNPRTWNDGSERANLGAAHREVADGEFVVKLLADLKTRVSVDDGRIYATGFSNGASMSFRLARELSRTIATAAPVAGADWLVDKAPERPVPILYITGTADPLNPLEGGPIRIGLRDLGRKPPIQEVIARWVKLCGAPDKPRVVYDKDGARGIAYGVSSDTPDVVLYTLDGHGHHWPGGDSLLPENLAGKNTAKLNATDVIWEFFKAHPLAKPAAAESLPH